MRSLAQALMQKARQHTDFGDDWFMGSLEAYLERYKVAMEETRSTGVT